MLCRAAKDLFSRQLSASDFLSRDTTTWTRRRRRRRRWVTTEKGIWNYVFIHEIELRGRTMQPPVTLLAGVVYDFIRSEKAAWHQDLMSRRLPENTHMGSEKKNDFLINDAQS